ncbi:ABC transporter ATP-binding protein [Phosphitispora fastidiosa]|uniref:ABC transporter ATP-binding protein n=1 Tax=Phosphitispora fastidiosa TaxID=2837202 RepID=UPI001E61B8C5|nr:ABC transporter ATP-binding protein [Phosphitispora fastidiosa]MBU7006214.1 simple sugar transport system ATP-binding protein [Phosphitispora fastidiosa]
MTTSLVKMVSITKRFPGVTANKDIDFELRPGEIHALLGENGAGKSTLMNILTGLYMPDEGEIYLRGAKVKFSSPRGAIESGIGMVHQHFRLVSTFSVAENVIMGSGNHGFFINMKKVEEKLSRFSEEYGINVIPGSKIWQLSVGEQQRVEIVKMLYRGTDIMILDEPTAVLTPQESRELFATLRRMADMGKGIIIISHKIQEVLENADRITVLRDGRFVNTFSGKDTDSRKLTMAMVDRDITFGQNPSDKPMDEFILSLKGLTVLGDRGQKALKSLSLNLRKGEILGIAGVAGNGQKELAEVIAGLREVAAGDIEVRGERFTGRSVRSMIDAGISLIPEDRLGTGLVGTLNVLENSILKNYRSGEVTAGWFINWKRVREYAHKLVDKFDVKTTGVEAPVRMLSGGNLQKLLLAREITSDPDVIVAVYPVRGLDVGAIEFVRNILLRQRESGKGILLISEELEELFMLSDRVAVMHEGEIMGILEREDFDLERVGRLMAGQREEEAYERAANR